MLLAIEGLLLRNVRLSFFSNASSMSLKTTGGRAFLLWTFEARQITFRARRSEVFPFHPQSLFFVSVQGTKKSTWSIYLEVRCGFDKEVLYGSCTKPRKEWYDREVRLTDRQPLTKKAL
ncbi:hypothetical protein VOLCADRAFT_92636 [Volvox carteri f. nagariensis]|uniref:Uncharacterized protein n=1 Tax=Volvox carteri f. nagariensis TaxID=3068 RepID=D8U060_VOLCA|nr:uncharacterized protein VOLCADRAFT_92636 [Volvox carteri f. nagariensis]EFJ46810.1 hypothetical protein VOLCADRAFT_92636 [Volvox carteri f. nagariensis]|eukprot:XP_002952019.1 hypothetical protein VOLCADRAFT_92636 [Volvox carteri f. nagariensis]